MLADSIFDSVGKLPGLVAMVGIFVGGGIAWIARRTFDSKTDAAHDRLVTTLEKTLERETIAKEEYKTKLHAARNEQQAQALMIKELESRPDLGAMTNMLSEQGKLLASVAESLKSTADQMHKHEQLLSKLLSAAGIDLS